GDHGVQREVPGDRPGDVVGDGGGADAAFGADDGDDAPHSLGFRRGEQVADRAHHVERGDRPDQIVADAAAHQLAIQRDVVDAADYHDAGAGVADRSELVEPGQDVVAAFGLEDDDIRGRRRAIGLDGGDHAAHL